MQITNRKAFIVSILLSLGTGLVSALATLEGTRGFEQLYKPPLTPPGWVFPPVWTLLYTLMGIAAYLIWQAGQNKSVPESEVNTALSLYALQLAANAIWSPVFFTIQAYFLALAILIILWGLIFLTIQAFLKINKTAAYLLIPYLLWVTFAGYLNLAIAIRNH